MKPLKGFYRAIPIVLISLLIGTGCAQTTPLALQDDAVGLARWQMTYDGIRDMSPKWGIQSVEAFKDTLDIGVHIHFLDVRTPKEWAGGVIKGAQLINLNALPQAESIALLPQDRNTIIGVYCKSGLRSTMAMTLMHQLGYKNAINMDGGWLAWSKAGYPTMAGPAM